MSDTLHSEADLAGRLGLPVATTEKLRRREGWPHARFGRAIRYTDEQIAQIVASHTVVDKPVERPVFEGLRVRGRKS